MCQTHFLTVFSSASTIVVMILALPYVFKNNIVQSRWIGDVRRNNRPLFNNRFQIWTQINGVVPNAETYFSMKAPVVSSFFQRSNTFAWNTNVLTHSSWKFSLIWWFCFDKKSMAGWLLWWKCGWATRCGFGRVSIKVSLETHEYLFWYTKHTYNIYIYIYDIGLVNLPEQISIVFCRLTLSSNGTCMISEGKRTWYLYCNN